MKSLCKRFFVVAMLVLVPMTAHGQKLLVVGATCSDGALQSWPGWAQITSITSAEFLAQGCAGGYEVVEIGCADANITSPAGQSLISDLAAAGVGIYSYKQGSDDVSWVPGGLTTSGLDTCTDAFVLTATGLAHPIATFPTPDLTDADFTPESCSIHGSYTGVPASYDVLATSTDSGNAVLIASNSSPGRIVIRGQHHHGLTGSRAVRVNDSIANWLLGSTPPSDADSDGVADICDNCAAVANPGQEDTCAASPEGDACDTDSDGDVIYNLCDNCPAVSNAGQEDTDNSGIGDACNDAFDADGDEFEDANDNCPNDPNPGIGNVGASALSNLLNGLNANNAALSALVPDRFDFSNGDTGTNIPDGGNDMYDGGNVLNTDLATLIPYTNGVVTASEAQFGVGSSYFTVKYTGVFAMAATNLDITRFEITGNNGADGSGSVDGAVLSTTAGGLQYTIYVKRVFDAFDPSINHIVIVPGDGTGVSHSFAASTDNDLHTIDGLGAVDSIFYVLAARQTGQRLEDADVISIANEFLSNFGQADSDSDGYGDACDTCVGPGADDGDGDGVCTEFDNCPVDPNPGQEDGDADEIGDACECGDGVLSLAETCDDGNTDPGDGCDATCQTESGYECATAGSPCTDIDECDLETDNCDINATCANDVGSFSCTCNGGYDGDGVTCADLDECALEADNCDANATCANSTGSFSCTCNLGFQGNGVACDLPHFVGYKVRVPTKDVGGAAIDNKLPKGWVITVNDVHLNDADADDPENFEVKKTKSLFTPAQKNIEPSPDLNGLHYLRYQMKSGKESVAPEVGGDFVKPAKHIKRVWQLDNQFGTINVESKKVTALLLPANKDLTTSPLPPDDANHFVCYQVKATKDITEQTPESKPGSGAGKFRKDLQAFFEDQFGDCEFDKEGNPSFPATAAAGKCLFDLKKVKELCNPMDKTAVEAPRQTSATITASNATTPRSLLCYQPKLARKFNDAFIASALGVAVGDKLEPGQAKHFKRGVKTGNPVHTAPGNLFPKPLLVDTNKQELVCVPTDVTGVTFAP